MAKGQNNYHRRFIAPVDRFLENVGPMTGSGCQLWTGRLDRDGYGEFSIKGDKVKAHRAAWMLFRGPIEKGMHVCHTCDVPGCVRIEHLFVGPPALNVRDMHAKGRNADLRGNRNPQCKLTETVVREIRASMDPGRAWAARLGVSEATISLIRSGKNWSHVQ